jgi:hypothetical protein
MTTHILKETRIRQYVPNKVEKKNGSLGRMQILFGAKANSFEIQDKDK